jgi:hypothetical protein
MRYTRHNKELHHLLQKARAYQVDKAKIIEIPDSPTETRTTLDQVDRSAPPVEVLIDGDAVELDDAAADAVEACEPELCTCNSVGNCAPSHQLSVSVEKWEKHTTDEPVSVLVTVTPAALVVMTVRQGTVVLLLPDMRTSLVTVKTSPAELVVVISVVGIGEGIVKTMGAEELPVAAAVLMTTPAEAQYCTDNSWAARRTRC